MCYELNIVFVLLLTFFIISQFDVKVTATDYYKDDNKISVKEYHKHLVDKFFGIRKKWTTSVLGSVLFKNKMYPEIELARKNRTFHILIWENVHVYKNFVFGNNSTKEYLSNCSVQNCIFYGNKDALTFSDAVVVNVNHFGYDPRLPFRNLSQKVIFYDAESPVTIPIPPQNMIKISNKLNWSMTYRTDSDVPIPYGRVVPLKEPKQITTLESISKLVPYWKTKTKKVLVAALISNCKNKYRLNFIKTLRKYLMVKFFGRCGDDKYTCGGRNSGSECLRRYYFYLALENSLCRQYITEKVFVNAFSNGAIPIIKGPPSEDCAKLLPPHSYILVDDFKSEAHLAREIFAISERKEKMLSYHIWRAHFKVMPENGFFDKHPIAFCRLCEAMNYNTLETSVYTYDDILLHLESKILCDLSYTLFRPNVTASSGAPPSLEVGRQLPVTASSIRYCLKLKSGPCIEL